ncbi:MAG: DUF2085 domain-containing protein [Limisphaerales bacterium]
MLDWLNHFFSVVCGQDLGHTWAPGGIPLPCCQRCLGLYAGAAVAAGLHLWLRPRLTGRFLGVHGAFLLAMAPFGFHWAPQGPALRTATGILFGFAALTYLWLPLAGSYADKGAPCSSVSSRQTPALRYAFGLLAALILAPVLAALGGKAAAYLLSGLASLGALAFAGLAVLNAVLGLAILARMVRSLGGAPPTADTR